MKHPAGWIRDLRSRLRETPTDPTRVLEAEIAGLASGLAAVEDQIAARRAAATAAEHTAIGAIRVGDDRGARSALVEQQDQAEHVARLETEVAGLRAVLDEARAVLAAVSLERPSPPEDQPL